MVHALEKTKRLLRTDGVLIDIHPVPGAPVIEVRSGERVVLAEPSPSYDYDDDLRNADQALAWVVQDGIFRLEARREFEFVTYASTISELRGFFAVAGAYEEGRPDEGLASRIAELDQRIDRLMRDLGAEAEIAHRERVLMARLTPVR